MAKKYKMKTKKGAAKRFWKVTARGKILRGKQGHGHFLSKMGQKARKLAGTALVDDSNYAMVVDMLPYSKAKRRRTKALNNAATRAQQEKAAAKSAAKK